jgi:spermidine/putrescine transport system ATP-binding protein
MSDRIAVMRHGRIEQLGAPEELYERPTTDFVAGFLGVSNLLDADVAGRDGRFAALRLPDGTILRAPVGMVNGANRVRLGVRPEKLRVLALGDGHVDEVGAETNAIDGTVLDASYIGVSTQYLVETADKHTLTVYAQNLETSGASEVLADGRRVRLTWKPQHTFILGPASSSRPTEELEPEEEELHPDA